MKTLGFTGTRKGMTEIQTREVEQVLLKLYREEAFRILRHGDCVGADEAVHRMAKKIGYEVIIHPPSNETKRAFCRGAKEVMPAEPYLRRNVVIVENSQALLAAPHTPLMMTRSGTWATVRVARWKKVPLIIVTPGGTKRQEGFRD